MEDTGKMESFVPRGEVGTVGQGYWQFGGGGVAPARIRWTASTSASPTSSLEGSFYSSADSGSVW